MNNGFVALCHFNENNVEKTDICNLFKRSFTNAGLGFTFNSDKVSNLISKKFQAKVFYPNGQKRSYFMKSASPKHSLDVVIENNAEEVDFFEIDRKEKLEPKEISVSLHNPLEPADIRSNSFQIPLGQSTKVYITPKATEVDADGMELTEFQRHCRLNDNAEELDIFNVYTRAACLFECKMKYSLSRCDCVPWNYPHNAEVKQR